MGGIGVLGRGVGVVGVVFGVLAVDDSVDTVVLVVVERDVVGVVFGVGLGGGLVLGVGTGKEKKEI